MNSHLFSYLHLKNIFTLKKSSTFANLLIEKPDIDLLHLFFLIGNQCTNNYPSHGKLLSNFQASTSFH